MTSAHNAGNVAGGLAGRHAHRVDVAMLLLSGATLALLVIFVQRLAALPLQGLCAVASGCSILLLAMAFIGSARGVWSATFAYAAVFWVFHFGLIFSYAIGAQLIEDEARSLYQWFFRHQTRFAVILATVGMAACVTGIFVAKLIWPVRPDPAEGQADDPGFRAGLTTAGFACVAVCVAGWLLIALLAGGPGLIFSDYLTWLAATTGMPTIWVYYGLGVGMTLLALGSPGRLQRTGYVVFGLWALVAFPLGLRGEVLFPLITALVVTARRRVPLSTLTVALLAIFLLVAIAVVRDLRMEGLSRANAGAAMRGNPLSALAELGSSLRPVTEVVTWHDRGEEPLYGATYWAPIDRAITAVLPLWERVPGEEDERIMNVVVQERVGPIGFSVVAEAYRNFGSIGVPVVMALLGVLVGRMESWRSTPMRGAILGIIFVELLFHVRNDFIAVPAHIALAAALVLFVRFVAHYRPRHAGAAGPVAAPVPSPGALNRGGADGGAVPAAAAGVGRWGRRRAVGAPTASDGEAGAGGR